MQLNNKLYLNYSKSHESDSGCNDCRSCSKKALSTSIHGYFNLCCQIIILGSKAELGCTFVKVEFGSTSLNNHRLGRTRCEFEVSCCIPSINSSLNDTLNCTALIRTKSSTFCSISLCAPKVKWVIISVRCYPI